MEDSFRKILSYIIIGVLSFLICLITTIILIRYIKPLCCSNNNNVYPPTTTPTSHTSPSHSAMISTIGLDVQLWLENNNIPEYYAILINIGIDNMDKLLSLNNVTLTEQTHMTFQQKHILLDKIKQYNNNRTPIKQQQQQQQQQSLKINEYNSLKSMSLDSFQFKPGHNIQNLNKKYLLNSIRIDDELYENNNNGIITKKDDDIYDIPINNTVGNTMTTNDGINMETTEGNVINLMNKKLDINNWENWSSDEICDWILTLDNGIYKKYERKLRLKFNQLNINKEAVILLAHIDWIKMFDIDKDIDITQHIVKFTDVQV